MDERVVGRDGGGGVNGGESSVWQGGDGGSGGAPLAALAAEKTAVVMAAAALRWRRWRPRQKRGVGVGGDGETTTVVMETVEKEGREGLSWLKRQQPNARHEEGDHWPAPARISCGPLPPLGHILGSFGKAPMRM